MFLELLCLLGYVPVGLGWFICLFRLCALVVVLCTACLVLVFVVSFFVGFVYGSYLLFGFVGLALIVLWLFAFLFCVHLFGYFSFNFWCWLLLFGFSFVFIVSRWFDCVVLPGFPCCLVWIVVVTNLFIDCRVFVCGSAFECLFVYVVMIVLCEFGLELFFRLCVCWYYFVFDLFECLLFWVCLLFAILGCCLLFAALFCLVGLWGLFGCVVFGLVSLVVVLEAFGCLRFADLWILFVLFVCFGYCIIDAVVLVCLDCFPLIVMLVLFGLFACWVLIGGLIGLSYVVWWFCVLY